MRSWRESHLSEIRQYQQAIPQSFPQVPSQIAPVTSAQLPWLAGLAASSCNDSVHIIECSYSLAEGLSEMFKLLIEGKLIKTNYVVIICASRNRAIDSCIVITGEIPRAKLNHSMRWGVSVSCPSKPEHWTQSNGFEPKIKKHNWVSSTVSTFCMNYLCSYQGIWDGITTNYGKLPAHTLCQTLLLCVTGILPWVEAWTLFWLLKYSLSTLLPSTTCWWLCW